MRQKIRLLVIILTLAALVVPLTAHAAVVGRFTLVTGQVDLLKGGKLPAIAAKVQDGVEPGDVIRTKTKAKAQLTMVDDSVITLAPESRLAIADYQYNPAREERRAVVRLFRGLVHTVVNRIIKTEEPDFIMETHTATIGVRGTNWYTLLGPNSTGAYLPHGYFGGEFQPLHRSRPCSCCIPCNLPRSPGQATLPAPGSDSGDPQNAGANDGHGADRRRVRIWPACPRDGRPISISLDAAGEPGPEALAANDSPGARSHSIRLPPPVQPAPSSSRTAGPPARPEPDHDWSLNDLAETAGCAGSAVRASDLPPAGCSPGRPRSGKRKNLLALIGAKEYY